MGLLTQAQEEVDYLERRAKVRDQQANQRVGGYNKELASYNFESANKTAEISPLQMIIDNYNTDLARFNADVEKFNTDVSNSKADPEHFTYSRDRTYIPPELTAEEFSAQLWGGAHVARRHARLTGQEPMSMGQALASVRPEPTYEAIGNTAMYDEAKRRLGWMLEIVQPVAPKAPNSTMAMAAYEKLKNNEASIAAINTKGAELKDKGESVTARNAREQAKIEREVGRFNSDIEIKQNLLKNEMTQPQQPQGSVFNETQVFQSISDWLK